MENIIKINGYLYKITAEGRFRRHWKGQIRTNDSRANNTKEGICPKCHEYKRLTVDHYPPLRESITDNHKEYICWECHSRKNSKEGRNVSAQACDFVQNCGKGHNTYLSPDLTIYCKKCQRVLVELKQIGTNEYEMVKII